MLRKAALLWIALSALSAHQQHRPMSRTPKDRTKNTLAKAVELNWGSPAKSARDGSRKPFSCSLKGL